MHLYTSHRITLHSVLLTASRQGQDKRGRRGSAAIPPNELSRENVCSTLQNVASCGNVCALKSKYGNMWQRVRPHLEAGD